MTNTVEPVRGDRSGMAVDPMKDSKGLENTTTVSTGLRKRGRKIKQASRADELRRRLTAWKQIPESQRPSLRALARELGTSHQLLQYYRYGLEIRQAREQQAKRARECQRITDNIRAQAKARALTLWEQEQLLAYDRRYMSAAAGEILLKQLEALSRKAKKERLNWWDIKTLKLLVKSRLPGAQELLQKCEGQALSRAETERASKQSRMMTVVVQDEHGVELQSSTVDAADRRAVAKHEAAVIRRFGTSFTVKRESENLVVLQRRETRKIARNNLPATSIDGG